MSDPNDIDALLAAVLGDAPQAPPPAPKPTPAAPSGPPRQHQAAPPAPIVSGVDMTPPLPAPPKPPMLHDALKGAVEIQREMEAKYGPPPAGHMNLAEVTQVVDEMLVNVPDTPLEIEAPVAAAPASDTPVRKSGVKAPVPVFTVAELGESFDIRNFASLATLTTSRWHAKVKDRTVAKEAEDQQSATRGAFDAYKHLLVGADTKLKRITAALDAARTKHYAMTLPWTTTGLGDDGRRKGARLLPNTLFFDYVTSMAQYKKEMDDALAAFLPDYPALVQQAQQRLGKRFDVNEFPSPTEIASRFDLSFDFQPVPNGGDFRGLPADQLEALARAVNEKTEKMVSNAMQDVWARLHAAMTHMEDRLASPDKAFHDTMVSNVQELSHLLGHLNVTNDNRLLELKDYIDKRITNVSPDDLRKKPTVRSQVCASVKHVLAEMDKKGGQP